MLKRYVLFQLPGWFATVLLLAVLHVWIDLSPIAAVAIGLALLVKDVLLYPVTKHAYDPAPPPSHARLIGRTVVAAELPGRHDYVRLDGELWRARFAADESPLPPGTRARVVAVNGLTLLVETER